MEDRVSAYPGKVLITPESGVPFYATLTMADEPTQEGTPPTKANLLNDASCDLLGIATTSVPNDAFAKLALGTGKYGYYVTIKDSDGNPLPGVTVSGISTPTGGVCITNVDGKALGVSTEASVTLTFTHDFIDLQAMSSQETPSADIVTIVSITIPRKAQQNETIAGSKTFRFSPSVINYDVAVCGGGGSGANGQSGNGPSGGGGGGGYITELLNAEPLASAYTAIVGAGGIKPATTQVNGPNGGKSSLEINGTTIIAANGGNGGTYSKTTANYGTGNGNGGNGLNASTPNVGQPAYQTSSLITGGGGGGGSRTDTAAVPFAGGSPYGGRGSYISGGTIIAAVSGSGYGGGGGGGADSNAGSGHAGAVAITWRYTA